MQVQNWESMVLNYMEKMEESFQMLEILKIMKYYIYLVGNHFTSQTVSDRFNSNFTFHSLKKNSKKDTRVPIYKIAVLGSGGVGKSCEYFTLLFIISTMTSFLCILINSNYF